MKNIFVKLIDSVLYRNKQHRIYSTDKGKIINLITSLRPIETDKKLLRLGPDYDGGYLLPNDLDGIAACFAPGVYKISQFEYACAEQGMKLFLADKSIDEPHIDLPEERYSFLHKYIGPTDNDNFITMETWIKKSDVSANSELILQMDIEGWEYQTILNMSRSLLDRFRIIVIEFHNLDKLWNPEFFEFASGVFDKLNQNHSVVHIHPNNASPLYYFNNITIPPLAEFTFYRNDRFTKKGNATAFPHKLDFRNVQEKENVVLPEQWYNAK